MYLVLIAADRCDFTYLLVEMRSNSIVIHIYMVKLRIFWGDTVKNVSFTDVDVHCGYTCLGFG